MEPRSPYVRHRRYHGLGRVSPPSAPVANRNVVLGDGRRVARSINFDSDEKIANWRDPPAQIDDLYPNELTDLEARVSALGHNQFALPVASLDMSKRTRSVYAPVATTKVVNASIANRVISLTGREFIQDVKTTMTAGGSAFKCDSKLLRPTDGDIFLWLSSIAKKFEEFKFHSLRFVYEPQVASTQSGQVGLFFDGDPTHLPPGNWNGFVNTGATCHGAVWAQHALVVPPWLFSSRKSYYTVAEFPDSNAAPISGVNGTSLNAGLVPAKPTDPLEYYPGLFGIVSEGVVGGTDITLGKVYLEYSISLKTQNVDGFNVTTTSGAIANTELAVNSGTGYFLKLSSFPAGGAYPFGTYPVASPYTIPANGQAGACPFKSVNISGIIYQQAISQLNILVACRWTAAAATNLSVAIAPPTSSFTAPVFTTVATTSLPGGGAVVDPTYCRVIQDGTNTGGVATTDMYGAWQLYIPSGYFFRIKNEGAGALTYFHMTISPWTFALQNS